MNAKSPRHRPSWMAVEKAAALLDIPAVTLRRSLERSARKDAAGTVTARLDGIIARKLGRLWRVWLDADWLQPTMMDAAPSSSLR